MEIGDKIVGQSINGHYIVTEINGDDVCLDFYLNDSLYKSNSCWSKTNLQNELDSGNLTIEV